MSSKLEKLKEIRKRINIEVSGSNYCDNSGVNIYVANHNCLKDIFYLPMVLNKDIASLISARLIYKNIEDRKKIVNECLYALPIEAHGGTVYSNMCLDIGTKMVKSGIGISIFPEGAYIKDDIIHRGRTGAARILFNATKDKMNVNLIPVAISVNKENMDLDSYCFEDDKVSIDFLPPVEYMDDFEMFMSTTDMEIKKECLHNVIDTAFINIADSLGKQYDNSYIELFPKGNVIYSDGTVIPTNIAQENSYIDLYKSTLEESSNQLIKQLKMRH